MNSIRINAADNVIVAVRSMDKGDVAQYNGGQIACLQPIPAYHKIALKRIAKGERIIKYGHPIGIAAEDILPGDRVHVHNTHTSLSVGGNYTYQKSNAKQMPDSYNNAVFAGYARANGTVGVRNDLLILPTVGCASAVCRKLKKIFEPEIDDGMRIAVAEHPYGCSQLGGDQQNTQKILAGIAQNPNFGGVLVVSLGCENNNLDVFKPFLADADDSRIRYLVLQDEQNELDAGLELLRQLRQKAKGDKRCDCPINKLCIGLKCGGSDGMSGVTANPLVGCAADYITGAGGSVIMTEIPEMFGAEQLLMNRCASERVFDALEHTVRSFKSYFAEHGEKVSENPSPGNKDGGITTLEEKSLGCVLKGGNARIADVIAYGERRLSDGLTVLQAPGNDIVSQTALAAAGAQIILFTTGRGTPLGSVVPVIKISSNTELYRKKTDWIDFDAGQAAESGDLHLAAKALTDYVLAVSSGTKTKSEQNGYSEFAIWKNGVTL